MSGELRGGRLVLVTVGVMLALFLGALDQTIVGTALPRIVADLQGLDYYSWVITAYLVAATTMTPISGKLGDLFGRKPLLLGAMVGFVLASALCGQSRNMLELVLFRGVQGLFAGALMSTVFASVADLYPLERRGRIQGVLGGIFGLASVVGPTVGGYLTDNIDWRWVFYVNVPIGALAILFVLLTMPRTAHNATWRDIDFLGSATLAAGLVPLLVALSITRDHAWGSPEVLGLLAVAAVMLGAFYAVEHRTDHPIVPFALFGNRTFAVSASVAFLTSIGFFGAIVYVPLIYQGVLGVAATNSGLLITPMMLGLVVGSTSTGQLMLRIRRYRFIGTVGIAVMIAGCWLMSQITTATSQAEVVRDLVMVGLGVGTTFPLYLNASQAAVDRRFIGVVTSQIQFFRSIGSTVGVAVLGAVLSQRLPGYIAEKVGALNLPPQARSLVQGGSADPQQLFDPAALQGARAQVPAAFQPVFDQVVVAVRGALAATLHDIFLLTIVALAAAIVVSVFLHDVPVRSAQRQRTRTEGVPAFGG